MADLQPDLWFDFYPYDNPKAGARLVRLTKQQLLAGSFFRVERRGTGAGKVVLNAAQAEFTDAILHDENLVEVGDANISATDPLGGFFLHRGDFEIISADERGGEDFGIGGPGLLAYIAREIMWSHTYYSFSLDPSLGTAYGQDPFDDLWRLSLAGTGSTLGAMAYRVIYEAMAYRTGTYTHEHGDGIAYHDSHVDDRLSNALPDLVMDFDNVLDSSGAPWDLYDGAFYTRVKTRVLDVILELVGKGLDVQMRGGRQLTLSAFNSYGRDFRGVAFGPGVIRFEHGVNIANPARRAIEAALNGSRALVGSGDVYAAVNSPVPWHVRRSVGLDSDAEDPAALAIDGEANLRAREAGSDVPALKVRYGNDPGNGLYMFGPPEVGGDAWVGDLVTIHRGSGPKQWNNADARIEAIQFDLTEQKVWDDPTVEFGSVYRSVEERGRAAAIQAIAGRPHGPHIRLCRPAHSTFALTYASTNGNDLGFGYLGGGGEEVLLWRQSVDGGPYPKSLSAPIAGEPIWFLRDYTHGCRWTSVDYGPEIPSSVFGTHQDHFRLIDNMDGTFSLQWNDGGTSDSGCDTVDGSFVDLRVTYTPGEGDCPQHIGYSCTPGTAPRAARCDHVHEHGLLDEVGVSLHAAHNVTYDGSAVGSAATNVKERLDELAGGVSSSISIKHLLTAHPFPICAHRGDIGNDGDSGTSQPENTLEAIRQAVKKGANLVEFDLYRDSQGVWQLMHDSTVTRTTDGTGTVASKTTAAMAALAIDGGYGYNASRHGTALRVPTLDQVLTVLRPYDVGVYFHLKETTDAAGTALATKIAAEGFVERGIVLCDGGASQAAAVKAVATNLETAVLSGVLTTVESQPNLNRLLARQDHPTSASVVNGHFPKPTDQYFEVTTHYGTDETTAIENAWTYGVRILMTNNLDTAQRVRERIVERSATLDGAGKVPIAQVPTGTSSSTVALGDHTHGATGLVYLPLTTVVGGVPELVWDADDSLIPTGSTPS